MDKKNLKISLLWLWVAVVMVAYLIQYKDMFGLILARLGLA